MNPGEYCGSIRRQMEDGATMAHTNNVKWEQWHASFNSLLSIRIVHQGEPSPLECVIGNRGTLNPRPGHSTDRQHTTGLGHHWCGAEPLNQMPPSSQTSPFSCCLIIIVNTNKCMEPQIRQAHHNFTEAVRHPEPASIWRDSMKSSKMKQMQGN